MTQADLAKLAGVSESTVIRTERGERCSFGTAKKISLALEVDPAILSGVRGAEC